MTPIDLDEDDHTAERADVAILHDITPVAAAAWDWPADICRTHSLPRTRFSGCTACAQEPDRIELRNRHDDMQDFAWWRMEGEAPPTEDGE